eukprot:CAMPEP_0179301462 /NCGR_PEP_ID=MMETSP0797-20121207/47564_1 /TAXON_ID=47934 /ORGANISM="Dinophysis acuminata, Strain DAEP01" /LENGTH=220 /DNA_ID=CAMNT_0021010967 /DNA_START=50 /DNA_END=712 /DNA_ORIENTATION=+
MPIIVPKVESTDMVPKKMSADEELFVVCGWGKCIRRLERVMKKKPNVNYKNEDGLTPMHNAAMCGSAAFCKKLLDGKADPNIPATAALVTPLEAVLSHIAYHEERDARLNGFDTVNRLDDTCVAVRPDLKGYYEVKKILEEASAVCAGAFTDSPTIAPNGSIKGGAASTLRAYDKSEDGSYSVAAHLRSGKYDLLKYEDGKLVEAEFNPTTGKFEGAQED